MDDVRGWRVHTDFERIANASRLAPIFVAAGCGLVTLAFAAIHAEAAHRGYTSTTSYHRTFHLMVAFAIAAAVLAADRSLPDTDRILPLTLSAAMAAAGALLMVVALGTLKLFWDCRHIKHRHA